jgi:hypothetical protein
MVSYGTQERKYSIDPERRKLTQFINQSDCIKRGGTLTLNDEWG